MMKRVLSLLLICALIAGCLIVLASCVTRKSPSGSSRTPVASSRTGTGESTGSATDPGEPDGEDPGKLVPSEDDEDPYKWNPPHYFNQN